MRILLVEDDDTLGDGLREGLGLDGHRVDWLVDGREALHAFDADGFDAVILDLALPGETGLTVLSHWRQAGVTTPVLVLTAHAADYDCVELLDRGADDYVVKPARLREIEARLRALIRRAQGLADNEIRCGALRMAIGDQAAWLHGHAIECSAYEYIVLQTLAERAERVVHRDQLAARLYGWADGPESNSLEVLIHNLRHKIGAQRIQTVRGLGYRLVP